MVDLEKTATIAPATRMKLLLALLFMVSILKTLSKTVADPDLWGYMAFGRHLWEHGRFLYKDIFSYVPSHKIWIYHEWLTGVVLYPIYHYVGGVGLQVLKFGVALTTLGLIVGTARRRGASTGAVLFVLFIMQGFLSVAYNPVRAQAFTYLFFALSLYLLEKARLSGKWRGLWWLVPVMVVWCNMHGGFFAGLGVIALYAAGEAVSRRPWLPYAGVLLLCGVATLVNPYGFHYWQYLLWSLQIPRQEITEWIPMYQAFRAGLNSLEISYILATIWFSVFLILWARWREVSSSLVLLVTLCLGVKHLRHLVFFWLSVGAYLPVAMTHLVNVWQAKPEVRSRLPLFSGKTSLTLGFAILLLLTWQLVRLEPLSLKIPDRPGESKGELFYPVAAVKYIQEHQMTGKLLTEFEWGQYLLWELHPQCLVALDARFDNVHPEMVIREYWDFKYARPNWRRFLDRYPPDFVLLHDHTRICQLIREEADWQEVFADNGFALFTRRCGLPRPMVGQH